MILKIKFMSADKDGWEYLQGPPEKIEVEPTITLAALSKEINDVVPTAFWWHKTVA